MSDNTKDLRKKLFEARKHKLADAPREAATAYLEVIEKSDPGSENRSRATLELIKLTMRASFSLNEIESFIHRLEPLDLRPESQFQLAQMYETLGSPEHKKRALEVYERLASGTSPTARSALRKLYTRKVQQERFLNPMATDVTATWLQRCSNEGKELRAIWKNLVAGEGKCTNRQLRLMGQLGFERIHMYARNHFEIVTCELGNREELDKMFLNSTEAGCSLIDCPSIISQNLGPANDQLFFQAIPSDLPEQAAKMLEAGIYEMNLILRVKGVSSGGKIIRSWALGRSTAFLERLDSKDRYILLLHSGIPFYFDPRINTVFILDTVSNHWLYKQEVARLIADQLWEIQSPQQSSVRSSVAATHTAFAFSGHHFAHHIWNVLSGIEKLTLNGGLRLLDKLLISDEPLGPIDQIYPELASTSIARVPRGSVSEYCRKNSLVAFQPRWNYITNGLADRIIRVAERQLPGHQLNKIEQMCDDQVKTVWIGLRLDNRTWQGQEDMLPHLISGLAKEYDDLAIIFDGWTYAYGAQPTEKLEDLVTRQTELINSVSTKIPQSLEIISLPGRSLSEAIAWGRSVNLYITPHGSLHHKIAWFWRCPGIVHLRSGTSKIQSSRIRHHQTVWARESAIPPVYYYGEATDKIDSNSNYTCCPHEILDIALQILGGLSGDSGQLSSAKDQFPCRGV